MKALVTGASSGIGKALAQEFARRGYSLVLVARDKSRLDATATALRSVHGIECEALSADLSSEAGLVAVENRLRDTANPVEILVNNAGIGLPPGGFLGNDLAVSQQLNELNIDVVMRLTHFFIPLAQSRGRGGILTISSIAGFFPGTPATTYSASKAWTTAFGEGLQTLLRGSGVTSTTVTPGFVRSEFHQRSGVSTKGIPDWLWLTADQVATDAIDGFESGKDLVIPGAIWKTYHFSTRFLPRAWNRKSFVLLMNQFAKKAST